MSRVTDEELEKRRAEIESRKTQNTRGPNRRSDKHNFVPTLAVEKLIAARIACGYTQEDLAFMLGVSRANVAMWESAQTDPRLRHIPLICQALYIRADVLLGLDDSKKEET